MQLKGNIKSYAIELIRATGLGVRHLLILPVCTVFVLSVALSFNAIKVIALSSDMSRAYSTEEVIEIGSLVSLDKSKENYVVLANSQKTGRQLVGVTAGEKNALMAINSPDGNVQIAVNGLANTLVSTLSGDIENGDFVAESAISGVGAKAKPGDKVIGIAQKSFNDRSENANSQKITDKKGKNRDIVVGYTPVLIAIGVMPGSTENLSGLPKAIQQWASSVAGRSVSLARIILCGFIAMIAITSLAVMVYSSIKNSLYAVSRNPLAKPVIFEALAQVMSMVALVSIISVTTMYAVLKV